MANKLRQSSARVSFFAFQDMITTVTGVLMIVMLLLSLEIGQRVADAAASSHLPVQDQLDQARLHLAGNLTALRQRQAELSALSNRVFVVREEDRSGKQPVLVALSATKVSCSRVGQQQLIQFPLGGSNAEFVNFLEHLNPRTERLVFYIRPSGIAAFNNCRTSAKRLGFLFGFDAAEEDREYVLTAGTKP